MKREKKAPVITHIMADGTVRDSIEGYEVPFNSQTEPAYRLLVKLVMCNEDQAGKVN